MKVCLKGLGLLLVLSLLAGTRASAEQNPCVRTLGKELARGLKINVLRSKVEDFAQHYATRSKTGQERRIETAYATPALLNVLFFFSQGSRHCILSASFHFNSQGQLSEYLVLEPSPCEKAALGALERGLKHDATRTEVEDFLKNWPKNPHDGRAEIINSTKDALDVDVSLGAFKCSCDGIETFVFNSDGRLDRYILQIEETLCF
jgi:hypothetical protein